MKEKILCAAIWYKELDSQTFFAKNIDKGLLVCGHRHSHCIDIVKTLAGLRTVRFGPDSVGETVQGFLTNTNRFVDRVEGYDIALKANQVNDRVSKRELGEGCLFSEDLY